MHIHISFIHSSFAELNLWGIAFVDGFQWTCVQMGAVLRLRTIHIYNTLWGHADRCFYPLLVWCSCTLLLVFNSYDFVYNWAILPVDDTLNKLN